VARELHDEIGQCVTAIHADAVAIGNRGGEPVRESVAVNCRGHRAHQADGAQHAQAAGIRARWRAWDSAQRWRELAGAFRQRHPQAALSLKVAEEVSGLKG